MYGQCVPGPIFANTGVLFAMVWRTRDGERSGLD
jgi:hypothetical protein